MGTHILIYIPIFYIVYNMYSSVVLVVLLVITHAHVYTCAPHAAMKSRFAAINNNVVAPSSFKDKCYYQLLYNRRRSGYRYYRPGASSPLTRQTEIGRLDSSSG